ncbi:MAG TPA: hypothetical protein VLK58_02310 [Conexibacter sp.]|nr:hypothetical protein [Conexibacter sp.]
MTLVKTLAATAGAVAALAGAAAPAHAVDDCPNAAVRAQQNSTRLPDCRAYELVSPVDKGGQMVRLARPFVMPDGNGALFRTNGGFAGAISNVGGDYVSKRTAGGWETKAFISPLIGGRRIGTLNDAPKVVALNADFTDAIISSSYPADPDDQGRTAQGEYQSADLFRWRPGTDPIWLTRPVPVPDVSFSASSLVWASADLDRVVVHGQRILSPEVTSESPQLYLYADGRPADLISEDEDGVPLADVPSFNARVFASADGSTIAFTEGGGMLRLRRDAADPARARTLRPSWGSERTTCDSANLFGLTADGGNILFQCFNPLRVGDEVSTVYVGDTRTLAIRAFPSGMATLGASSDFATVVLSSRAADPIRRTLHVSRDSEIRAIATGAPANGPDLDLRQLAFSADGDRLVFNSYDDFGVAASGGLRQVYSYAWSTGEFSCISCPADGSTATGEGSISSVGLVNDDINDLRRGSVSEDGRRIFFTSVSPLVAADRNGKADAYMWKDGELHLLGSGTDDAGTGFAYASADGSTAFIYAAESLAPQDIDNGVVDVYAVRVGGGFLAPRQPEPCTTGCQGPPRSLESLQTPGTVTFTGPADADDPQQPQVVKVFSVGGIGTRTRASWARGRRAAIGVRLSHGGTAKAVLRARIGRRTVVVGSATRTAAGGGSMSLPLKLSRQARAALRRQGSLRVTLRVTVAGAGGGQTATFTLKGARR